MIKRKCPLLGSKGRGGETEETSTSNAGRRHQPSPTGRYILPGGRKSHPNRATFPLSNLGHCNGGKVGGDILPCRAYPQWVGPTKHSRQTVRMLVDCRDETSHLRNEFRLVTCDQAQFRPKVGSTPNLNPFGQPWAPNYPVDQVDQRG